MPRPATRRCRPSAERLESIDLPSAVLPAYVNLASTPVASEAKTYLAASTPSQGRQRGTVNSLVAVPETGDVAVAGVMTIRYRVKIVPTVLSPLYQPSVSFSMRIDFATSLDNPRPGDVAVSYTSNLVPFGSSVRAKVAAGLVAFLRHDRAAILAASGQAG
jgi:hypothetical protein